MCGRFAGFYYSSDLTRRFHASNSYDIKDRWNIAPSQDIPTIIRKSPNKVDLMRWGLIPSWSKTIQSGYSMINLRAENIVVKPYFKRLLSLQRCLIPTSGFYEWKRLDNKEKLPYFIRLKNKQLFAFAGLYDIWKDTKGKEIHSCTIITTTPNSIVSSIHDRMPVILTKDGEEAWLDSKLNNVLELQKLLKPYSDESNMETYPISKLVNNPINDKEEVIEPLN